jgi:hypothetical protein
MSNMHDSPSDYNFFQKHGHVGRYTNVQLVKNATGSFTGSAVTPGVEKGYGAGGIIVGESSTTGHAHLSNGGSVNLAHLVVGTLYEFGVKEVACNDKHVYVLKRNVGVI